MTRRETVLSVAGINPQQGEAEAAALLVRRLPLRLLGQRQPSPEAAVESGWCSGLDLFSETLSVVSAVPPRRGLAFGCRWPWFDVGGRVVAPGLPVRLGTKGEEAGPDGIYSLSHGMISREAAGRSRSFLSTAVVDSPKAPGFSLLWFSDTARFLVRGSELEIEDLFSKTRCSVDQSRLEQILVRAGRVDSGVLGGMVFEGDPTPTTLEVSRMIGSEETRWNEPEAYLKSRIDVEKAAARGERVEIEDVRGEVVEFRMTDLEAGWKMERVAGRFPFEKLSIQKEADHLVLSATLAHEVDIFTPGLRGRLVFDLNADLGALQKV